MELQTIKSLGPKSESVINKLNVYSVESLLEYYPYRYNIIKLSDISNAENDNVYLKVKIVNEPRVSFIKKNFNRLSFKAITSNLEINITIFNRAFLKKNLYIDKEVIIYGKYNTLKNTFLASDIKAANVENTIEPVYKLKNGIKSKMITNYIEKILLTNIKLEDGIPEYINNKYKLLNKMDAIKNIHLPRDINVLKQSKIKLIYEELFEFIFKINYRKIKNQNEVGIKRDIEENKLNDFISDLPFKPTKDQVKAFEDIKNDLKNKKRMQRLILGDVGSGKTLVAAYAIYINYLSSMQTAFLVPTEILATQHFKNLKNYYKKYSLRVEILTGKMSKKEKKSIKERLLEGEIDLLIGTHALISEDIIFKNLGLVITDEQHRFGVMQRRNLENKGINPDIMYLSATPIPRTYALILYNDTDVSYIKTKPSGRKEIITKIYKEKQIKDILGKMYEEIKLGRQAFVVSPLIENEESDLNSVNDLKEKLKLAFKEKIKIEIIHGNMKENEKDSIMNNFKENEIQILISTTVIEVGIDIPNASIMTIFNAERFGLATLHQLRGRVGRGDFNAYCYLISDKDSERLKIMEESNDGFYITEKDYELRNEGDLFGTKQSGEFSFKISNLKTDKKILLKVQEDVDEFINSNKYLESKYYKKIMSEINNLI